MKKTLALVLSVAMVFGLMAFPASADFEDSSDIQYTEAVDVMTACGVINGFEDGSFDPTGTLTREQAAKVIAYLMLGGDTADALVATTAPFDDVAATRWSAGYIAYCVSSGIVSGRDGKTFDPTGSVTGYEFAKMLLVALGYDASVEVYTGSSWAVNVAKTALDIDLFDGNDGANYNTAMTREEAALYAFNTLQATLVDYDSTGTSIDLGNGIIVNTGATKAEDVEDSNDSKDTIDSDGYLQFAEKYFTDLERDDDDKDDFGRPATTWTYDDDDVGTYAAAADLTYTAKVKCSAIYSDTNDEAKTADYIVDGETQTDLMLHDISGTYYNDDAADKIGGNGTLIEVYYGDNYDEDDGGVLVVEINTYVGYISDWNEATDDYDEYVTIDAYSDDVPGDLAAANDDIDDDSTFVTAAFDDDDADDETVVLFTCALNDDDTYDIESVVPADSVTAFVTRSSTDKFVAGGTTYKYSANYDVDNVAAYDSNADDAVIYL
ncbi:MAG: S-layer homology domain-containing protein, partial [Oscillospiraceae bacterium]